MLRRVRAEIEQTVGGVPRAVQHMSGEAMMVLDGANRHAHHC